ncbi:MAG: Dihydrofolate reductase [Fusobacteria bacterium]|nr:MAG: Dihydrofolate reductase [Fusobacteriota bacterium]KAF0229188.1 MAG: Dihydrofolate [Fusobacteriota bacterium]
MKKVVLYIAMSLDGYIADKNGGVSWLVGEDRDIQLSSYDEFIKTVDTIIMGNNSYSQITTELSPDKWVYEGMKTFVLTHRDMISNRDVEFTKENIVDLVNRIRAKASNEGKDIWLCGGSDLVHQFMEKDLIDRYHVTVIPTILGAGIRLFKKLDQPLLLKHISNRAINGMVDVVYDRR